MTDHENQAQTIARLVAAAQEPSIVDSTQIVLLPHDCGVESLERFQDAPNTHRGVARLGRVESFIEYVKAYKGDGAALYVNESPGGGALVIIDTIFDHRSKDQPRWERFGANFEVNPSRQYREWAGINGKSLGPDVFARFLHSNRNDVIEPQAGKLIEILRDIRGTAKVEFTEAVDEWTGAKSAMYAETIKLKGGKADVDVPTGFTIAIPVYDRQKTRVKINCFLRAEVIDGKVKFAMEMDLLEEIKEQVVDQLIKDVSEATQLGVFYGSAAHQ